MAKKPIDTIFDYTADDIIALEGLDPVRKRPGMYIGSTSGTGLHHTLWEIVDNSIDEAMNGFATEINVTINPDGSATVEDNGRGIPIDKNQKSGMFGVEIVFTKLHAGGKFNKSQYKYSGGLHGVGASVTNALSRWLTVEVYKNGKIYHQEFHSPEIRGEILSGIKKTELQVLGKTNKRGTKITYMPDDRVFDTIIYDSDVITHRLQELAYLNGGKKITFVDLRNENEEPTVFYYTGGLVDYVEFLDKEESGKRNNVIFLEGSSENCPFLQVAFQHRESSYSENLFSFVNNINTSEGGTHETGFKSAYTKCLNDFAKNSGILTKAKISTLSGEDLREGMTCVLSVKLSEPQFEGQTKTKLGNSEVKQAVENLVGELLDAYLKSPKNKANAEFIVKKAVDACKTRDAEREAKNRQRQKNSITGASLIGKYASCTGKAYEKNELFIVEGDSAGGSAKMGRDRRFQAVLPLKGKPLNVMKARRESIYENDEIKTIIAAIGTDVDRDFNIDNLKFGKIIILSDADYDGYHIRTLLLAFFYKFTRRLITDGKIFVGMPPLYRIEKKGDSKYAYDEAQLDEYAKEFKSGYEVQRYKGLGEMNATQLWETTLNPRTRLLTQVTIEDAIAADTMLNIFMHEDSQARKDYIAKHANFNKIDTFAAKYGKK